ncbi:MAG: hypothetical protein JWO67_1115 [Streptosporangiaceae bacterium]|nr:hypothetical protein [Streptosporangiaceae bacterium]
MTALPALAPRGRHRRPPLHRRILASLRTFRQRRAVEEARDNAYLVRIEAHAIPPQALAQATLAALHGVLHHEHGGTVTDGFNMPPAAVLPDEDVPGLGHLARPDWEFPTGTWPAYVEGVQ